jgi:hypothetical protein
MLWRLGGTVDGNLIATTPVAGHKPGGKPFSWFENVLFPASPSRVGRTSQRGAGSRGRASGACPVLPALGLPNSPRDPPD